MPQGSSAVRPINGLYLLPLHGTGGMILTGERRSTGGKPIVVPLYSKQIPNIYYDRQTQQCFLLTCYFINYRMSL